MAVDPRIDPALPHKGRAQGHDMVWDPEIQRWRWADTMEAWTGDDYPRRPCLKCGREPTPEGHDACLGKIEGASCACCGHGRDVGYVAWSGDDVNLKAGGHWLRAVRVVE